MPTWEDSWWPQVILSTWLSEEMCEERIHSFYFAFRQTCTADPLSPTADEFFFFSPVPDVPLITVSIFTVFPCHQEIKLIQHIKRPLFCSMEMWKKRVSYSVDLRLILDVWHQPCKKKKWYYFHLCFLCVTDFTARLKRNRQHITV